MISKKTKKEIETSIQNISIYLKNLNTDIMPNNFLVEYLIELKHQYYIRENLLWKRKYQLVRFDLESARKLK